MIGITNCTESSYINTNDARLLLGADLSIQVNRARATVDLLHAGSAVAFCVIWSAVEFLAAIAGVQDVALISEGVAKFTRQC